MQVSFTYPEELQIMNSQAPDPRPVWADRIAELFHAALPLPVLLLVQRFALATIFFLSGRTKVDGWFTITDTTYELFRYEYAGVPLPSDFASVAATVSEHIFPMLLVLGLMTRFSALALLGMTATIQLFVYPDAWPTHLSWAALALPLVATGGGMWSLDHVLRQVSGGKASA
jgi:putative oxidoreductase